MQDLFVPGTFNVNAAFFFLWTLLRFQMSSEGDIQKVLNLSPSQEMLPDK